MNLKQYLPAPPDLIELPHEALALPFMKAVVAHVDRDDLVNSAWISTSSQSIADYVGQDSRMQHKVEKVLAETWAYLVNETMIIDSPGSTGNWQMISRKGYSFASEESPNNYNHSRLLPKEMLSLEFERKIRTLFISGDYDTAVFKAYRMVEVKIRTLGGYSNLDVGTKLARKAFSPDSGPLTEPDSDDGEKDAMSALFAGALGTYKNPSSHRDIEYESPVEVAQILHFANHLLKILETIDSRINGSE